MKHKFTFPIEPDPAVEAGVDTVTGTTPTAPVRNIKEPPCFRTIADVSPAAVALLDRDLNYVAVNRRWIEQFDLQGVDLEGRSHLELFPGLHESWKDIYARCLDGEVERSEEDILEKADGSFDWVRWEVRPWADESGETGGISIVYEIVTRHRDEILALRAKQKELQTNVQNANGQIGKLREKLRNAQAAPVAAEPAENAGAAAGAPHLMAITDHAPFGLILLDHDGNVEYANPQHRRLLGFGVEDEEGGFESWLRRGCPDEESANEVSEVWRDAIWRRQLTKVFTLATAENILKDVEFRATLMEDGHLLLTLLDVTDSRRAQEALQASEVKFRALFKGSGLGIVLMDDRNGNILDINPACERMLGFTRRQFRMMGLRKCILEDDVEKLDEFLTGLKEGEKLTGDIELRLVGKDQKVRWIRMDVSFVRDPKGEPLFNAYFLHDLTTIKKANEELIRSEKQNRALLEAIPDLILLLDRQGKVLDVVPAPTFPHPIKRESAVDRPLAALIPEIGEKIDEVIEKALETGEPVEESLPAKDGGTYESRVVASSEREVVALLRHREKSPEPEPAPAAEPEPQSAPPAGTSDFDVVKGIPTPLILTDLRGKISHWNRAAVEWFGYSDREIVGTGIHQLFDPENPRDFNKRISREINERGRWEETTTCLRRDGTEAACRVVYMPLRVRSEPPTALVATCLPVTPADESMATTSGEDATASDLDYRMKDNLQLISSLLSLQLGQEEAASPAFHAIQESQNRIRAIAFLYEIHQRGDTPGKVDFRKYCQALIGYLLRAYDFEGERPLYKLSFDDESLPLASATSLALIVHEVVALLLKHAAKDVSHGEIDLNLDADSGELIISSTLPQQGDPVPEQEELAQLQAESEVLRALVDQAKGTVEFTGGEEKRIRVHFELDE